MHQWGELEELPASVEIVSAAAPDIHHPLFSALRLSDKDRPVVPTRIGAGATHLFSGDWRPFVRSGHSVQYGRGKWREVLVLPPREYPALRTG